MNKLREEDYITLYPYWMPEEIKEEFKEFSASTRGIRRVYEGHHLPPVRDAQQNLFKASQGFSTVDPSNWNDAMLKEFTKRKQEVLAKVWERVNKINELYNRRGLREG